MERTVCRLPEVHAVLVAAGIDTYLSMLLLAGVLSVSVAAVAIVRVGIRTGPASGSRPTPPSPPAGRNADALGRFSGSDLSAESQAP